MTEGFMVNPALTSVAAGTNTYTALATPSATTNTPAACQALCTTAVGTTKFLAQHTAVCQFSQTYNDLALAANTYVGTCSLSVFTKQ